MDWEPESDPPSHHLHGDESVPGAWPERDPGANPRKRKSSFDGPALKRSSPPRATIMTTFLTSLGSYSPFRLAKRVLLKSDGGEGLADSHQAAPPTTRQSNPRSDGVSRPQDYLVPADSAVPSSSSKVGLNTTRSSQSRSQLAILPIPSPLSTSSPLDSTFQATALSSTSITRTVHSGRASGTSRRQQRDKQKAFARAALMNIKQPSRTNQLLATGQRINHEGSIAGDIPHSAQDLLQSKEEDNHKLPGAHPQKISLSTIRKLAPIQLQQSCNAISRVSPSLPHRSKVEHSIPADEDSDSEAGTADINQAWTLPRTSLRISKAQQNLETTAPALPQDNHDPDQNTLLHLHQRPLSQPPLCSRPVLVLEDHKSVPPPKDPDVLAANGDLASEQTAECGAKTDTHDPTAMPASYGSSESAELRDALVSQNTDVPATNVDVAIDTGLVDYRSNRTLTNGTVAEPDISNLRITEVAPAIKDIPKAVSHSDEKLRRLTRAQLRKKQLEEEALNQYEIVALPAVWEAKVRQAVQQGYGDYAASDLARAVPEYAGRGQDNWLNDEVINGYLNLVTSHGKKNDRPNQTPSFHAFNSFFYTNLSQKGPESVMRWSKRPKINGSNLLNVQAVFIPINTGLHWTLAVVEPGKKRITHYNSMRSTSLGVSACKHIKYWVAAELGKDFREEDWALVAAGDSPQQSNSDDCGVFTITSARQIMLGFTPMSYRADQMRVQRKRIVAELVNGALIKSRESMAV